jgi:phosphatidyl-myo-inositol alpha-mannosyltransferase
VQEHVPNARFVIVGDGPLRAGFQRLVERAGWRDVLFVGRVSDEELPSYYASADVFVAPNTGGESQGIVLLEALAAGAPTIASDIPGFRTVIRDSVEGILVPPSDHEQLAWAICHLLGDRDEQARLRALGLVRAESYSWPRVAQAIEAYYVELMRGHQLAPAPLTSNTPPAAGARANGLGADGLGL